jgi:hypothetical protein
VRFSPEFSVARDFVREISAPVMRRLMPLERGEPSTVDLPWIPPTTPAAR